ncbi:MAG: regulatory protein RecX [Patescibacteria group bacterium]
MEDYRKYLPLAYRYLTIRNRSEKEVRDYFTKKDITSEIVDKIIVSLYAQKFLNDELFARSWIRSRARSKPKGRYALEMELKQKGISAEIIEKIFAENQEDLPDELTQAKQLIQRKMEKLKESSKQEIYQKVGSFLSRRGFSWEITKKAIDSYL